MHVIAIFLVLLGLLSHGIKGQGGIGVNVGGGGFGLNPNFNGMGANLPGNVGKIADNVGPGGILGDIRGPNQGIRNPMVGFSGGQKPVNQNFPAGGLNNAMGGFGGKLGNQNIPAIGNVNVSPINGMENIRNFMAGFGNAPENQNIPLAGGSNNNPQGGLGGIRNIGGFNGMPENLNIPAIRTPNNNQGGIVGIRNVMNGFGIPGNQNIPPANSFGGIGDMRNFMNGFGGVSWNQNMPPASGTNNMPPASGTNNMPPSSGMNNNPVGGMGGIRNIMGEFGAKQGNPNIPPASRPNNNPMNGMGGMRNAMVGVDRVPGIQNGKAEFSADTGFASVNTGITDDTENNKNDASNRSTGEGRCQKPEEPSRNERIISQSKPDMSIMQVGNKGQMSRNGMPNLWFGQKRMSEQEIPAQGKMNAPGIPTQGGINIPRIPGPNGMNVPGFPGQGGMNGPEFPEQRGMNGPRIPAQGFQGLNNEPIVKSSFPNLNFENPKRSTTIDGNGYTENISTTDNSDNIENTETTKSGEEDDSTEEDVSSTSGNSKDTSTTSAGWFSKFLKGLMKASKGANNTSKSEQSTTTALPATTLSPFEMLIRRAQL